MGKSPIFSRSSGNTDSRPAAGALDTTSKANSEETTQQSPDTAGVTNQPERNPDANLPAPGEPDRAKPPIEGTDDTGRDATRDVPTDEPASPFAIDRAASLGVQGDGVTIYTSHPIARFRIGRFHFENATLRLSDSDSVAELDALLEKASPRDKALVKKIDVEAANELARNRIADSSMSKSFDSSVGRDSIERLVGNSPLVGAREVFTAAAQMDHNRPIEGVNVVDDLPAAAAVTQGAAEMQEPNDKGQAGEKPEGSE